MRISKIGRHFWEASRRIRIGHTVFGRKAFQTAVEERVFSWFRDFGCSLFPIDTIAEMVISRIFYFSLSLSLSQPLAWLLTDALIKPNKRE